MTASLLYPSQCLLGEGPVWHAERKSCFWVDILNGHLYELLWAQKEAKQWKLNYNVTAVMPGNENTLLLGLNTGIGKFHLQSETLEWLLDIEPGITENRCNDGRCDSQGRLWIGTMHRHHKHGAGSLYCIDGDRNIHKKLNAVSISNGLAWSLDDTRLYHIDSPTQQVNSFIYERTSGNIYYEKTAVKIPPDMGTPDGMTIDEEGMLWIAHWGGYGVYRWNPFNGQLLDKIEIPAPHVSSCTFAGEKLEFLVITTAREHLTEIQLKKYPQSGDVFCAMPGVRGKQIKKCIL